MAFNRHCTARKATVKLTHFSLANLAIAAKPTASNAPEKIVKNSPVAVEVANRLNAGARKPKTTVITVTKPAEASRAIRDERPYRIHASSPTPKAVVPRYPALEIRTDQMEIEESVKRLMDFILPLIKK